jgi:DNA helicase HerA-like ATPase
MAAPRLPNDTEHVAIAGRTGSGKTVGALNMLSMRNMDDMAWIIIDHKRDEQIAKLPAEKLNPNTRFLPSSGLHVIHTEINKNSREEIEGFLERAFQRGKIGIYVDEGHLLGPSDAIRTILVAGRSKRVPLMWTSQRAQHIDPFIWSQATFYRVFDLQSPLDIKRFNENFPIRWKKPERYHSWYYDVAEGKVFIMQPSEPMGVTENRLDLKLRKQFKAV